MGEEGWKRENHPAASLLVKLKRSPIRVHCLPEQMDDTPYSGCGQMTANRKLSPVEPARVIGKFDSRGKAASFRPTRHKIRHTPLSGDFVHPPRMAVKSNQMCRLGGGPGGI